jgi:hypothetical protein
LAVGKFYYNDEAGAKAMAGRLGAARRSWGPVLVGGVVSAGLTGGSGSYLRSYAAGGDRVYVGEHGDRYEIRIRNLSGVRVEVVVSVDGLDVLDGREASVSKRGYLVAPYGTLDIEGFRRSETRVAAFRFGSVADSYAERKHGDSRNVGVVGVAVFTERGADPWAADRLRPAADPFPGSRSFATPP